jgi:hypothetical protein
MYLADVTKSNNEEMTMPQTEHCEMLVLGSDEGGKFPAWHMAQSGLRATGLAVVRGKTLPVTLFELRAA